MDWRRRGGVNLGHKAQKVKFVTLEMEIVEMGNLQPVRSTDEARERGKAGGIASGIARRKKRDLRLALLALMDNVEDGQTGAERMAAALFKKAVEGDIKAIAMIAELVEQGNSREELAEIGIF